MRFQQPREACWEANAAAHSRMRLKLWTGCRGKEAGRQAGRQVNCWPPIMIRQPEQSAVPGFSVMLVLAAPSCLLQRLHQPATRCPL